MPRRIDQGGETMKIVVIGGTGLIGSKTVAMLRQGGHEVVAASPTTGVNTITGEGPQEAMACAGVRPGGLRGDAGEGGRTGHSDTGTDLL
jgi:hypothetical protein